MRTLTDEDVEAIVQRLLQVMSQRLTAGAPLQAIAPQSALPEATTKEPPQKLVYTLKELSAELGVSRVTIYRLVTRGLLKPLPYFRTKVFAKEEVERFLSEGMDWNSANRPAGRRGRRLR